jgi:transposase-like protein
MDEKKSVEKALKRGSPTGTRRKRYTFEEKLRAVKLHLEEGFKAELVSVETGVSTSSLGTWLRDYRKEGEMGLRRQASPRPGRPLPRPVKEKIKPVLRGEADRRRFTPLVLPGGEPGDGPKDASRGRPHERAGESPPQPGAPALL